MTQNTIATHVQTAQDALKKLLKSLTGNELPLEASSPEPIEAGDESEERLSGRVVLRAEERSVAIGLDPEWVPILSDAMLGEALEPDADGAIDLVQEVGSQGFGTIQSTLAGEGLELPTLQFEAVPPEAAPSPVEGPFWEVSFSAETDEDELTGVAYVPRVEETASEEETTSEPEAAAAGAAAGSPQSNPTGGGAQQPRTGSSQAAGTQRGGGGQAEGTVDVSPAAFDELGEETLGGGDGQSSKLELLAGVDLEVRVELGRRELQLADVLKLTTGSVVELEKMVGEPLSVYANGRLIAEGEAVVIDEQFGVRITNLASETRREKAFF